MTQVIKSSRERYVICCICSSVSSLLGFVNPLLSGVLVNQFITALSLPIVVPIVAGMLVVKGLRILLRFFVSTLLKGNPRAPLIWLQNHVGKWLWWTEPILSKWGLAGMTLKRISKGVHNQIGAFLFYSVTDTAVTVLSGIIFYFTHNYVLSLVAALFPALGVTPWIAKKAVRIHHVKKKFITT